MSLSQEHLTIIRGHFRQHWRRIGLIGLGGAVGLMILVQLFYPWGALPLFATIDGIDVSGKGASEATALLDSKYKSLKVGLYFGNSPKVYREPTTADIGIAMNSKQQAESVQYAWWLRLIPTSLWWAHAVVKPGAPTYTYDTEALKSYMKKELGESCSVTAVNASLVYKDKKLQVVPAIDGGTCNLGDVQKKLAAAKPTLATHTVRMPMVEHPAAIHDDTAKAFGSALSEQTSSGMAVTAAGQTVTAAQADVLGWIDFATPDTGITVSVNAGRAKDFFDKQLLPKVAIAPGVSKVTTLDFTEISRVDGASGRTLDAEATIVSMNDWLQGGDKKVVAATKSVAPTVSYTRTYTPTDTGISALIAQFAEGHPGTYGVSFAELDGKKRRATYRADTVYRTASTYKLFVAYGALKRVESGAWHWSDQIQGGRDLTKCLDDMIVKSDNACGEVMLEKIGYKTLTTELKAIGLSKSSFLGSFPETTASDLTTFVGALQSGQLLNASSTTTLLNAMKRNVYRQGIPVGASGTVGDKVGFLDAFLHDAAVVYGPNGTYVLTVMTEGSSWANIAELTRQIEKVRAQ